MGSGCRCRGGRSWLKLKNTNTNGKHISGNNSGRYIVLSVYSLAPSPEFSKVSFPYLVCMPLNQTLRSMAAKNKSKQGNIRYVDIITMSYIYLKQIIKDYGTANHVWKK